MGYNDSFYNISVQDADTGAAVTKGIYVFVYKQGTKELANLYTGKSRIKLPNPIPREQHERNGAVKFFSDEGVVDIYLNDDKGNEKHVFSATPTNQHVIKLDRSSAVKHFVAPFDANNEIADTKLKFPENSLIYCCSLEVLEISKGTISVGFPINDGGELEVLHDNNLDKPGYIDGKLECEHQVKENKSLAYKCSTGVQNAVGYLHAWFKVIR